MASAASVLVCVLSLLGRSADSLPPITLLDVPPPEVSVNAEAFARRGSGTIYLVTSSEVFQAAQRSPYRCGNSRAIRKLASIIVHEEWHIRNGSDEKGAYTAQLLALIRFGERIDSPLYGSVQRSMLHVLESKRRRATATLAAMTP